METNINQPRTLQEVIVYISDSNRCIDYVKAWRWPDGNVICPTCGSRKVKWLENQRHWQCSGHRAEQKLSGKVGMMFEDSPLGLERWLAAMWLIVSYNSDISSCEISRVLGVPQKTAWFMDHQIRLSMQDDFHRTKIGGRGQEIVVDESFIGGKARNMQFTEPQCRITGTDGKDKTAVVVILERGRKVRTIVVPNLQKKPCKQACRSGHGLSYRSAPLLRQAGRRLRRNSDRPRSATRG